MHVPVTIVFISYCCHDNQKW